MQISSLLGLTHMKKARGQTEGNNAKKKITGKRCEGVCSRGKMHVALWVAVPTTTSARLEQGELRQ